MGTEPAIFNIFVILADFKIIFNIFTCMSSLYILAAFYLSVWFGLDSLPGVHEVLLEKVLLHVVVVVISCGRHQLRGDAISI